MPYFYDIIPGNKVPERTATLLSDWLASMCSHPVTAYIIKEPGIQHQIIKQRIQFDSEEDRNLFALYVSGLDLTKK